MSVTVTDCTICHLTPNRRHKRGCPHYDAARELLWRLHNPAKAEEDDAAAARAKQEEHP
jgi:hypothetical protein